MKSYKHRAVVAALAIALSVPPVAAAFPRQPEHGRDEITPIVHVIRKIQKLFGISTNEDLPQPPLPKPAPTMTP